MGSIDNTNDNLLFQPIKLGRVELQHRVALAPLTRFRATKKGHVPIDDLVVEYYRQRSSTPGTFLVTEATFIAPQAGGSDNIPGIWSDEQIETWRKVSTAVHKNGSFIFSQIYALGRAAEPSVLAEDGFEQVSSSDVPLAETKDHPPRPLTVEEIEQYTQLYAQAAENAIKAGFDGVELHGANGYLLDQFISEVTNKRTDKYGGSIENRSRFILEVVQAVVDRIGADRTAIRFSPFSEYLEMKQPNPIPQFAHVIQQLAKRHPNLAYVHFIEPRVGGTDAATDIHAKAGEALDFARSAWKSTGRPFLVAGGFTPQNALDHMSKPGHENDVVVFGRWFIANPDLPERIKYEIALNPYDRSAFYTPESAKGYIDYPCTDEVDFLTSSTKNLQI